MKMGRNFDFREKKNRRFMIAEINSQRVKRLRLIQSSVIQEKNNHGDGGAWYDPSPQP